jgi:TonB family protein
MPRFRARRRAAVRREPPPLSPRPSPGPARQALAGPAPRPPRTAPWLLGSLALHLLLVAAALLSGIRWPRAPQELPPPAFEVVYEGGGAERPLAEPPPGLEAPPAPPPTAAPAPPPSPAAPPAVAAPPLPPSPPVAAPSAPPAPVPEQPRPPAATAAPPVPPIPAPPPLAEFLPRPPEPSPRERIEAPSPPSPPVAQPPPPPPQQQAQRPAPERQAAPAFPPGAFFLPEGVPFGRPQPEAPAGRPQARGLDLTVDPRFAQGRAAADPQLRVTGAQVGADWRAAFRRWLDQNIRYPRRAIELQESGSVRVRVVAAPDGRVLSVRLMMPSGSPSLNIGTTFPFEGASLPPFPPPADPNGVTIDLTVNYILVRR